MTTLKRSEIADKTQSLLSFKRMATKYGIQNSILINNSLHGKIYIFKSNGVPLNTLVTSANATHNGFSGIMNGVVVSMIKIKLIISKNDYPHG